MLSLGRNRHDRHPQEPHARCSAPPLRSAPRWSSCLSPARSSRSSFLTPLRPRLDQASSRRPRWTRRKPGSRGCSSAWRSASSPVRSSPRCTTRSPPADLSLRADSGPRPHPRQINQAVRCRTEVKHYEPYFVIPGAAGTVTGSRFLLEKGGSRILVDCGLFRGSRTCESATGNRFRFHHRASTPCCSLTPISTIRGTCPHSFEMASEARSSAPMRQWSSARSCGATAISPGEGRSIANRHGFSRHKPALPLYTVRDAEAALPHLSPVPFNETLRLPQGPAIRLRHAGHILGAASIECDWDGTTIVFSGDLGRYGDAMMLDPEPVHAADYLVVESTYGNRRHDARDIEEALGEVIARTISRGGTVIIPPSPSAARSRCSITSNGSRAPGHSGMSRSPRQSHGDQRERDALLASRRSPLAGCRLHQGLRRRPVRDVEVQGPHE